jgi:DNA-binding phage protein
LWREIVEEWLDENERTQSYLARHAHVSIEHLNRCLMGHAEPGLITLTRLEDAIGLDRGTLFEDKGEAYV